MRNTMGCLMLAAAGFSSFMLMAARADEQLDRGRYLVNSVVACGNCHTPKSTDGKPTGPELSGGEPINSPVFSAFPANITPDMETGIGKWTDAQIIDAIRNGRRPDGTIIGPPMAIAFYREMSDTDVKAIVAYLRQVKPVSHKVAKSTYKIPLPPSYGPEVKSVPDTPRTDKVAYGHYLANGLGHCMDCHTPLVRGRNDMSRVGAGGNTFGAPGGNGVLTSPNLTPANKNGVAGWTDAQVKTAITKGVRPDGGAIVPLMAFAWYKDISPDDQDALVAYIRSLKPVE
jgi:mono/diheme cytochrome c family protein